MHGIHNAIKSGYLPLRQCYHLVCTKIQEAVHQSSPFASHAFHLIQVSILLFVTFLLPINTQLQYRQQFTCTNRKCRTNSKMKWCMAARQIATALQFTLQCLLFQKAFCQCCEIRNEQAVMPIVGPIRRHGPRIAPTIYKLDNFSAFQYCLCVLWILLVITATLESVFEVTQVHF